MPAYLAPCLANTSVFASQAAWLSAVSPDDDEVGDTDPLNRSLQNISTLNFLALLDNPVNTKGMMYSEDAIPLAGSWQVRFLPRQVT